MCHIIHDRRHKWESAVRFFRLHVGSWEVISWYMYVALLHVPDCSSTLIKA